MASLKDLRKRTGSVRSIRQITKAMKMVAAARLRRAQESIIAARPYARKIEEILADVVTHADLSLSPLLAPSTCGTILLIVITADKGLCGAFNTNVIRRANRFLAEHADRPIELITVGRKARDYFVRRGRTPRESLVDIFRSLSLEIANTLRNHIIDAYLRGEIGEVRLIHNEFKSALTQRIVDRCLLPICDKTPETRRDEIDFEYEPGPVEVFTNLLPKYIAVEIWTALLESYSAEMAARMTSMEAATKNASEMISRLTLVSNRMRQSGITREIAEIVGGAEAST